MYYTDIWNMFPYTQYKWEQKVQLTIAAYKMRKYNKLQNVKRQHWSCIKYSIKVSFVRSVWLRFDHHRL